MMHTLSRRTLIAGAAGFAAMPRVAKADMAALEQAANKEGALTWYTAHTDGEVANLVAAEFMKLYPAIKVGVVRTTAQVAYQRLLQDMKNGIAACDVFSTTDIGHDIALAQQGKLAKYTPENAKNLLPQFSGLDTTGTWFPTLSELVIPIYSTRKVKAEDAPKSWTDLLDPRWRNQVAVGHPAYSGTVGTWVIAMRKMYGWSYFERLEKNKPLIGRSVNDAVGILNSGERSVAAGPSGVSQVSAEKGNPIGIVKPTDGAVILVSPSAVMESAPHPNAARFFMEYLLGPVHGRISNDVRRVPVIAGITTNGIAADSLKTIRLSTAEIVKDMQDCIEQWRDTFG